MAINSATKKPPVELPDLRKPETLREFQSYYEKFAKFDNSEGAFMLADNIKRLLELQSDLETSSPELYRGYDRLQWKLNFIALTQYPEDKALEFFKNHFSLVYEIPDYDPWQKIKSLLVSMVTLESRNLYKRKIIEALRENNEIFTPETVTKDGVEQKGTIKSWLIDSVINLGTKSIPIVQLADYLVNSPNTKNISADSREKLRSLLILVEKLKTPSDDPAGFESVADIDEEDAIGAIRGGVLDKYEEYKKEKMNITEVAKYLAMSPVKTKTGNAPDNIDTDRITTNRLKPEIEEKQITKPETARHLQTRDIIKAYTQNPEEQRAIAEEERAILAQVGQGTLNVRQELDEVIQKRDRIKLVAFLIVLAKTQDFFTVMAADAGFRQSLKDKYGVEAEDQFSKMPADPIFYSLWLQYILRNKIGMLESDSARIATKLANLLGRKYLKASFIDTVTGTFKWATIRKEKDRLTLVT
ncbi:MAG: hypothetical protein PHI73_00260 [Patescibacteria group bacterium]|nr:hypothetical protein [Patescibacteria group bacterium]